MTFEQIFENTGWYITESFADGVVIFIEPGPIGNEMKLMQFDSADSIFPVEFEIRMYSGMFKKDYVKVYNRNQLFGKKKVELLKSSKG